MQDSMQTRVDIGYMEKGKEVKRDEEDFGRTCAREEDGAWDQHRGGSGALRNQRPRLRQYRVGTFGPKLSNLLAIAAVFDIDLGDLNCLKPVLNECGF